MKNRVRELRMQRDLSQGELAKALRVSRQTVNAIETERYTPSLPLALAIVRFFATTVEEVFDLDVEEQHSDSDTEPAAGRGRLRGGVARRGPD